MNCHLELTHLHTIYEDLQKYQFTKKTRVYILYTKLIEIWGKTMNRISMKIYSCVDLEGGAYHLGEEHLGVIIWISLHFDSFDF